MLKEEKNFEFRKRLLNIHTKNLRKADILPKENEIMLKNGVSVVIPKDSSEVVLTAAQDFLNYLFVSMNTSAMISTESATENAVECSICPLQSEDYIITFDEKIHISGKNDRGIAQALYCLEDKMNIKKAPILKKEDIRHTYLFSPRMVHSGYGIDNFPNEHLASIAHAGMDAILIFVSGINMTHTGFVDFNELIYRASRYGIDVYAYSYLKSLVHPEDDGAQDFYDNLYGTLFRECPGLKGVIFVGESIEFPSHDPNVVHSRDKVDKDGFPTGKTSAGWWPCYDYPLWIDCVKKAIRTQKADADIVFWSYNWSLLPKEPRLKLIDSLPTDITLMATFETSEYYRGDIRDTTADYTLAVPGPGEYFTSEAEAAKKRGIRMYTMSNTAGTTWDMGVVPYEPMPYQWLKRYKGLREANEKWGLCGLMDSHHFGFWPSFIGDFAKQCFIKENTDFDGCLSDVLAARYGEENVETLCKALRLWSDGIDHFTPTDADQYGAFRIGPAYPFCLIREMKPRSEDYAHFGNAIMFTMYPTDYHPSNGLPFGKGMLPFMRVDDEIKSLTTMYNLMREGTDILRKIENPNEELEYLINMGEYICCYVTTGINAKIWYKLSAKIRSEANGDEILKITAQMRELLKRERENAEKAIEFVRKDSRLGWEPSMEYMGDEARIIWKLKHIDYVLEYEIGIYEKNTK